MSKGWQEYRLEGDDRWQATGQLRDAFPFGAPTQGTDVPARKFFRVDGYDTENMPRAIFVPGDEPERGKLAVHTLGWSQFTRP